MKVKTFGNNHPIILHGLSRFVSNHQFDIAMHELDTLSEESIKEFIVNTFLAQLKYLHPIEIKIAIRSALDYGLGCLNVESSFELYENQRCEIRESIFNCFGMELNCEFNDGNTFIRGIEINASAWKLNWDKRMYHPELIDHVSSELMKSLKRNK